MATGELVTEQFQFLGIDIEKEVLDKCVDLCENYNIDAETFVEQWMAFSLSHLNGAPPSLKHLESLERKEFSKRAVDLLYSAPSKDASLQNAVVGLTVYGADNDEQTDTDVLSNYMTTTPKRVKIEKEVTNQSELRPATYSPTVAASAKYASRTNARAVIHSYGNEKLLEELAKPNDVNNVLNLNITQVPNEDGEVYTKASFGFELLNEKASAFDNHISYIAQYIMRKHNLKGTCSVRQKTQNEVLVAGRIECDADARLNPKCVVLQGTWEDSLSQSVPVDIDNLKQYTLFPGQVVVMRGVNPRGDRFVASEIYSDATLPLADHKADITNTFTGTLSIIVAAGPFTTSDNLSYEPLKDLISYIETYKPHLVIMNGPFLDCEHAKVRDNSMAETFNSFFDKLLKNLGDVMNTSPMTKIYIVSSYKDAFHINIYPTPPYSSRKRHPNIHFLPDPCTININGVVISATSTDVLMQISQEEISLGADLAGGSRLSRLTRALVSQQALCCGGPVDSALWAAHAHLRVTPHLLLLPSGFRHFVTEMNGCVVVNPERLTKGTGGGTFARILIRVDSDTEQICKGVAAQIVRI